MKKLIAFSTTKIIGLRELKTSAEGIAKRARTFKGVVRRVVTGKIVMKVAYGVIRWEEDAPEYESLL